MSRSIVDSIEHTAPARKRKSQLSLRNDPAVFDSDNVVAKRSRFHKPDIDRPTSANQLGQNDDLTDYGAHRGCIQVIDYNEGSDSDVEVVDLRPSERRGPPLFPYGASSATVNTEPRAYGGSAMPVASPSYAVGNVTQREGAPYPRFSQPRMSRVVYVDVDDGRIVSPNEAFVPMNGPPTWADHSYERPAHGFEAYQGAHQSWSLAVDQLQPEQHLGGVHQGFAHRPRMY